MAWIQKVRDKDPVIDDSCFLAQTAVVVGDVVLGKGCSVWFGAVVRGDVNAIRIGQYVNIQDNAVIHNTYQKTKTLIGNHVSIGHGAIVHGCTIEDFCLIGMGAVILDGAIIRSNSLVAAGAVVLENTVVESGCIYAGIPAKKVKEMSPETFKDMNERIALNYPMYASWFNEE